MINIFPPSPPVAPTFVQASRLTTQFQDNKERCDANDGSIFGTQEDHHNPPQ